MTWHHCEHEIADTEACPECGTTKQEWTVEVESTREFQVRRGGLRIELLDQEGEPVEGERYRVEPAEGMPIEGELDADGWATVATAPVGVDLLVTFPDRCPGTVQRVGARGDDEEAEGDPNCGDHGRFTCRVGPRVRFRLLPLSVSNGVYARLTMAGGADRDPNYGTPSYVSYELFNTDSSAAMVEAVSEAARAARGEGARGETRATNLERLQHRLEALRERQASVTSPRGQPALFVERPNHDLLIPLKGKFVAPEPLADDTPLVFFCHGSDSEGYFGADGSQRAQPSRDYEGYAYLQDHLAAHGIASLSVDVNVVDEFKAELEAQPGDYAVRAQILLLWLLLLKRLSGAQLPEQPADDAPLFVVRDGQPPVPLPDALEALPDDLSPLREAAPRLDLERLGVVGHSRGGAAVVCFWDSLTGPSGARELPAHLRNSTVERANRELVRLADEPTRASIKCLVPFEPAGLDARHGETLELHAPETFVLFVAGSHDMDVHPWDVGEVYERAEMLGPRALVMIHGATHVRFNQVWRAARASYLASVDAVDAGVLSDEVHERAARFFVGGAMRAMLRGEPDLLRRLTGALAPPAGVHASRDWGFGLPLDGYRAFLTDVQPPASVPSRRGGLGELRPVPRQYASYGDLEPWTVRFEGPPPAPPARLRVAFPAEGVPSEAQLGFSFGKFFEFRDAAERAAERIDGFTLHLRAGDQDVGSVRGADVPSPLHSVVHATLPNDGVPDRQDVTGGILQRVQVPLSQFGAPNLAQVTAVEIELHPQPNLPHTEVFVFARFELLTQR